MKLSSKTTELMLETNLLMKTDMDELGYEFEILKSYEDFPYWWGIWASEFERLTDFKPDEDNIKYMINFLKTENAEDTQV